MTEEVENPDPSLNITLKVTEINTILAAIQELPFKVADPMIKNIIAQAQAQLSPPELEVVTEEVA